MNCCFFASLKTLLISTKVTVLRRNQRPRVSSSLASFEVTLIGRFWVIPEATRDMPAKPFSPHTMDILKLGHSAGIKSGQS